MKQLLTGEIHIPAEASKFEPPFMRSDESDAFYDHEDFDFDDFEDWEFERVTILNAYEKIYYHAKDLIDKITDFGNENGGVPAEIYEEYIMLHSVVTEEDAVEVYEIASEQVRPETFVSEACSMCGSSCQETQECCLEENCPNQ